MNRFIRFLNTVKYLKSIQIFYRIFYTLRGKWRRLRRVCYPLTMPSYSVILRLLTSIPSHISYTGKTFTFLNLSYTFETRIDWNYARFGKLWTYNLTYFDFLQQNTISKQTCMLLINDFIAQIGSVKDGMEPFPISLRGINWIKFLTYYDVKEQKIDDSLYAQYHRLMDNLEYHLLGNHLLENGFSLLFGAYYFKNDRFYSKARKILSTELLEQTLSDGAHFELSPMYHQIMLYRILDCINLVQNNSWKNRELLELLRNQASLMVGWLNSMTYENGDIPHFNDSTNAIAPTTKELLLYAETLQLTIQHSILGESGYRKKVTPYYECVIDVGQIGPDYIPGHAHADTHSFELRRHNLPFIVDTGLSTYETGKRRHTERSTAGHNTVVIDGKNSSEVWGGFRVAERARIVNYKEDGDSITTTHNGYKKLRILHKRRFEFYENTIIITDELDKNADATAYIHFHPEVDVEMINQHILILNGTSKITSYEYAEGFNKRRTAKCMVIHFHKNLTVKIAL